MRLIMPVISKSRRDQVIYRLNQDQVAVHTRLKNINPQIGVFLLKPREEGDYLIWELENSQIHVDKITEYSNLDGIGKSKVHEQLDIIKELLAKSGDDPKILDIPSLDSIKLLETNFGQKVVVDSWGHLPFDSSKGVNIINFTPKPSIKSVNVELLFHYFDKSPAHNQDVAIYNNGFVTAHKTDLYGIVSLGSQMIGKDFQIEIKNKLKETIITNIDNNKFEFQLPYYTDVTVKVIDQNSNDPITDYKVSLLNHVPSMDGYSNTNGILVFKNVIAGERIHVSDNKTTIYHYVAKENNFIEFRVIREANQEPETVHQIPDSIAVQTIVENVFFTVYDLAGVEIQDYNLAIQQGGNLIPTIKDLEYPYKKKLGSDELNMNLRSVGVIKLKENGKEVIYRCKFKTQPNIYEYSFQIKKVKNWWWLLWLIPLILSLLFNFGKDIHIKVKENEGKAIPKAGVNMKYEYNSLFNFSTFKFFTTDSIEVNGITDSLGLVTFDNNPTTIFDFIFKLRRDAKVNILVDTTCYAPTAALIKFYKIFTTHELTVQNKMVPLTIYVKETNNNSSIAEALVNIIHNNQELELKSDQDGKVVLPYINACSIVQKAYAFKDYAEYGRLYSDTLNEVSASTSDKLFLYINEPEPCRNEEQTGDERGVAIFLSTPKGDHEYSLEYDFFHQPDRLLIYSYPDRNLIHDTGLKSYRGSYVFRPNEVCNDCKIVYMVIQTFEQGTRWTYKFRCNNN